MTSEQALKMAKAKLECIERQTSGKAELCNNDCESCSLCYEQGNMGKQKEWLKMAIKALENQCPSKGVDCEDCPANEPCEDAISRQAVDELSKELVHTTRDKADFLCNFWEGLQKLPPVTPTISKMEKVGKWIVDQDAFSEINGYILKCHCSECNHKKDFYDHKSITTPTLKNVSNIYNFCPNCGAKMEVEE